MEQKALTNETMKQLKAAYKAIDDKLGLDTIILDISSISSMADFFIITSGSNANQLKAIADNVEEELFKCGVHLKHGEGYTEASWILLDFGDIIVHVFSKENREFYSLERIWADAERIQNELLV